MACTSRLICLQQPIKRTKHFELGQEKKQKNTVAGY